MNDIDVQQAAAGDRDAFGRVVRAHQTMVSSIAYAITGDLALSEDISQEVFLSAWRRLDSLRDPSRVTAWLAAITRNRARNELRQRRHDPLHGAVDLEGTPGDAIDAASAATRAERERVTWQALAQLPETYREPLVLFYREAQSVRQVAELLSISDDCARQRLSRGREMLKAQVASVVEGVLTESRPGNAFAVAVLAALPAPSLHGVLSGTAVTAAAAKGGAAAKGAGMVAVLGWLAGPVIGVTGGFFGMWRAIRNSTTLLQRRYALRSSARMYAFIQLFLGYQGLCGLLFWRDLMVMLAFSLTGWAVYLVALMFLIVIGNVRARYLEVNDAELRAAGPLEESELSLRRLWGNFWVCMAAAVAGSVVTVVWVLYLPGAGVAASAAVTAVEIMAHAAFYILFRRGVAIARDDVAFLENAPSAIREKETPGKEPAGEKRSAMISGLAGGQLGGSLWLVIDLCTRGEYAWCAGVTCVILSIFGAGVWLLLRRPQKKETIISGAFGLTGVILSAVLFLNPPEWFSQLPDSLLLPWRAAASAVLLGLYTAIAGGYLLASRRRRGR